MTQTAQHTPGPWEDITYSEHAGFLIKTNGWWNPDKPRDKAMMIAAPELLKALEQALVALNTARRFKVPSLGVIDSYAVAAICEAAIAKAKGDA